MDIAPAVAADLAALADATGDGGRGLRNSLDGLRRDARAAISGYLGLSVTVAHPDGPLTLHVLEAAASDEQVAASLHLQLAPLYRARAGSTLTLYSARKTAFDELATGLMGLPSADGTTIVRDRHLELPGDADRPALADASAINQAVGVLHERGFGTVRDARAELARLATAAGIDLAAAALVLLHSVTKGED